jgi:peroxiredoxin
MKRITAILTLLLLTAVTMAVAGDTHDQGYATVGKKAPDFTLVDAQGETHYLSDYADKYVVLEWVNFDCPFVKKHYGSKNMQTLQAAYQEKEVVWLSICSSAPGKQGYFDGDDLAKRIKAEGGNASAYLIDADGTVGRMYEAKTTPHMFVIDPEGTLVYAGAIDDHPSTKIADIEGATNYVQLALDASMAGEEVETDWTKSYGCSVKYGK